MNFFRFVGTIICVYHTMALYDMLMFKILLPLPSTSKLTQLLKGNLHDILGRLIRQRRRTNVANTLHTTLRSKTILRIILQKTHHGFDNRRVRRHVHFWRDGLQACAESCVDSSYIRRNPERQYSAYIIANAFHNVWDQVRLWDGDIPGQMQFMVIGSCVLATPWAIERVNPTTYTSDTLSA